MIELRVLGSLDLTRPDGKEIHPVLAQPKRLALLAYLALATPRGLHRRDKLVAVFWPKLDQLHARNSLSQALRFFRRHLGPETIVVRGNEEVGLDPDAVWCDVVEYEKALANEDLARALEIYKGDLLVGFFLSNCLEFEEWLEAERKRLRESAAGVAWAYAHRLIEEGQLVEAERTGQRALALVPTDESAVRGFIEALAKGGDRAAAVRFYEKFARKLQDELDLEPSARTRTLLGDIRAGSVSYVAPGAASAGPVDSVAVLPLANLSGDSAQDYFSQGMQDAIIGQIGRIRSLKVISRTSTAAFSDTAKSAPQIARELGVDALIEGSVLRHGNRVRIQLSLIKALPTEHQLWGHIFESDLRDVLKLYGDVAFEVCSEVEGCLGSADQIRVGETTQVDHRAYELFLQGRYFLSRPSSHGLLHATECFEEAIRIDPEFAPAYAGLSEAIFWRTAGTVEDHLWPREGIPRARAAAERALELDDYLAEAHTALALVLEWGEADWTGAAREYRRAIELTPSSAVARAWYATFLVLEDDCPRAHQEIIAARDLDPLSLMVNQQVGWIHLFCGDAHEAINQYRGVLGLEPEFDFAHYTLGFTLQALGDWENAVSAHERAVELGGRQPIYLAHLGRAYVGVGRVDEARILLGELSARSKKEYVNGFNLAYLYLSLGQVDDCLDALEHEFESGCSGWLGNLKREWPLWEPVHDHPRFRKLLDDIGLEPPADHRRTVAAPGTAEASAPEPSPPHRRKARLWGRSRGLFGVLSVGLLFAAGALTYHFLPDGAGGGPAAEAPPWTILSEMEGSAPSETRKGMGHLLASAIDASGVVLTLPSAQLALGLERAMKPDTTAITTSVARELAYRAGLKTVFSPRLDRSGGTYLVTVRVWSADRDSIITAVNASAASEDGLVAAAGEAAQELARGLEDRGLGRRRPWAEHSLVTPPVTASFEAFRLYMEGREAYTQRDNPAARSLYRAAVELDPDFAAAWTRLAVVQYLLGFPDSALAAMAEARDRPERLPGFDGLFTDYIEAWLTGEAEAQFHYAEQMLREYPHDLRAYNNLALAMVGRGGRREAIQLLEEQDTRSPFGLTEAAHGNLVGWLSAERRFDEALERTRQLSSARDRRYWRSRIAAASGEWERAEREALASLEDPVEPQGRRGDAFRSPSPRLGPLEVR